MTRAAAWGPMDAAAASGRLAQQRCEACGAAQYPPMELCRVCLSEQLVWAVVDAAPGDLVATTAVHHSFDPSVPLPQRVGLVRLAAGATAVCFVDAGAQAGAVQVRAHLDTAGRAVLVALPC